MDVPKNYNEAVARGFKPVTDPDVIARLATAMKHKAPHDLALAAKGFDSCIGKPDHTSCGTQFINGKIVQCYCIGGACDPASALWAPEE